MVATPSRGEPSRPVRHTAAALLGAWFFCILLPCFLLWWHNRGRLPLFGSGGEWRLDHFAILLLTAGVLLTPGTLVLGCIALWILRRRIEPEAHYHGAMIRGALLGVLMAGVNFPGYLGLLHLERSAWPVFRLAVLYAVTGALCGAWVGWQVYRDRHPEARVFPHFSLRTLLLFVVAWAVLIGFFMPLQPDDDHKGKPRSGVR